MMFRMDGCIRWLVVKGGWGCIRWLVVEGSWGWKIVVSRIRLVVGDDGWWDWSKEIRRHWEEADP